MKTKLNSLDLQITEEDQAITIRACNRNQYEILNKMQIFDAVDAQCCAYWLEHLNESGYRPETWEHLVDEMIPVLDHHRM